jgi:uncharacterized protein
MVTLGLALAALIGLSLGLLGGGGSVLTVPVLVYVFGFAVKPAIAMSLPVVGLTSLIGATLHWRQGNVRVVTALTFGVVAMVGAFAGARLAVRLSDALQLSILAVVMLAAAASMIRGTSDSDAERGGASTSKALSVTPAKSVRWRTLGPLAFGVGVLTGLVGIGGGFLVVPALVILAHLSMRQAVGTSLLVIAMNSASGFAGYVGSVHVDAGLLAAFTAAAIGGALVGARLTIRIPPWALQRVFAVFLLVMGGLVLYENRGALRAFISSVSSTPRDSVRRESSRTVAAVPIVSYVARHSHVLSTHVRPQARAGELHDRLPTHR